MERAHVTTADVGGAGLFLLSDLGAGVTGEVMYVDSGYNSIGMANVDNAKQTAELLNGIAS